VESKFLIFFKFSLKLFSKTDDPGGTNKLQTFKKICLWIWANIIYASTPIFPHFVCTVPGYSFKEMFMLNIDVGGWKYARLVKRNI